MKKELPHFYIDESYGGNQDWFPTFMMRIGGCGAETACDSSIYFALYKGITGIAPESAAHLTKQDYIDFAYVMRPYLSPRMSGIDRLDIYVDGYAQYLKDRGETRLSMDMLDGSEPYETAAKALIRQIDEGYPIPTLILNHKNKTFDDYVWHWFLLNGYDLDDDGFLRVKAVTYSKYEWLDFRALWETGHKKRGGLILFRLNQDIKLFQNDLWNN